MYGLPGTSGIFTSVTVPQTKKIEQLLATTAQNVQPDELSYKDILAQILYYGKDIKPEMWADFHEIDAEIPEEWTKKKTKMFDEIQSYGQYQI